MKLNEVVQQDDGSESDYWFEKIYHPSRKMTEEEMIVAVNAYASLLEDLYDAGYKPSEKVIWTAIKKWPWAIRYCRGDDATDEMKSYVLGGDVIVKRTGENEFNKMVKDLYPNNELMQKKWIRFGNRVREEIRQGLSI